MAPPADDFPAAPVADAAAAQAADPQLRAWRHGPSWARVLLIAVPGLALDLWSKDWAFRTLWQGGRVELIPNLLEFQTMLNPGALFGIGGGQTTLFLIASGIALLLVGWMFAQTTRANRLMHIALGAILAGALGNMYDRAFVKLQEGAFASPHGAIYMVNTGPAPGAGTTYVLKEYPLRDDYPEGRAQSVRRVSEVRNDVGFVRDFIKISQRWFGGGEVWPWVFNVADMLLVGGVGILALQLLTGRDQRPPAATKG